MLSFLFLLSVLVVSFVFLQWKNRRFYQLASKLKCPTNVKYFPLLGNIPYFLQGLNSLIKLTEDYKYVSPVGAFWMGPFNLIAIINKPEHAEIVLNNCLNKPTYFDNFKPMECDGVIFARLNKWKKNRKILNPLFCQKNLDAFVEVFVKHSEKLSENLTKKSNNKYFDIIQPLMACNFDIFFETALGIDSEVNEEVRKEVLTNIESALKLIMKRFVNPFYHFDFIFSRSKTGKDLYRFASVGYSICEQIFDRKLKDFERDSEDWLLESKKKLMFLDYLIYLHSVDKVFTKKEVVDELAVFIIAGFETCSIESAFTCLMLGLYQDIQEKVFQEVVDVLGDRLILSHSDLNKLAYTEKVIKETLRLFPIGPSIIRGADEEIDLGDDVILPKDAILLINILGIHRNEKYYENPMQFNPERFTPEEALKRSKYSFLTFSTGPRNCMGGKFAMMSLKTLIATLVRKFRIETTYKNVESIELQHNFTLKSIHGYPVKLTLRE